MIESCEKVQADGWRFNRVHFLRENEKICCPLMAVAIANGYLESDRIKPWEEYINEALGLSAHGNAEETSGWSKIYAGYDTLFDRESSTPLYKLGQELAELFPPI